MSILSLQNATVACSLATSLFFLVTGCIAASEQSLHPIVRTSSSVTSSMVALYTSIWFGGIFACHFAFPRASWEFVFGRPMPDGAFSAWRGASFAYFMIGILPLVLSPTWGMFAWMLFFWPLNLFLTHTLLVYSEWTPRPYVIVAPLHYLAALLPILLMDASTID